MFRSKLLYTALLYVGSMGFSAKYWTGWSTVDNYVMATRAPAIKEEIELYELDY